MEEKQKKHTHHSGKYYLNALTNKEIGAVDLELVDKSVAVDLRNQRDQWFNRFQTLWSDKTITVALLRDLEKQVIAGEISYSKMVEILNEKANARVEEQKQLTASLAEALESSNEGIKWYMENDLKNSNNSDHEQIDINEAALIKYKESLKK